jgi:hypothetical protein
MTSSEADEGFKVTDRRRRADEPAAPASPPPAGPAPAATEGASRSLAPLFMMLASSAVVALGDAADPVSGERVRDLPQAAELIDLLILLRERTEGRRLPEESQVLEEILYDLQLRYVTATRRG